VDAPRLLALLRRERRPLQAAARAGVDAFHPKRPSRPPAPAEPPVGLLPGPDAIA
jgi:hypothetical protein